MITAKPHPLWLNDAENLASDAGLTHDTGKAAGMQTTLASAVATQQIDTAPSKDPVRHEIISALIVAKMLQGSTWPSAWTDFRISSDPAELAFVRQGISTYRDALLYCVATHHKLFNGSHTHLNLTNHAYFTGHCKELSVTLSDRHSEATQKITETVVRHIIEKERADKKNLYWQGIAVIARAALILADHHVSAEKRFDTDVQQCFANTQRKAAGGKLFLNQGLAWHLAQAGHHSGLMVRNMAQFTGHSLSHTSIARLIETSPRRYAWQNTTAAVLKTVSAPALIINIAGTGAGKTRMNARAAAVLAGDKPLRLSVVLNLRSLTLQTGDVFRAELGIQANELAVIVGDEAVRQMHAYAHDDIDAKELAESGELTTPLVAALPFSVPEWLTSSCKSTHDQAIIMTPVLVSTIDYLINAGDPRHQRQHALALLRLMHSDLIIDEIDSYEPSALAAVLRIIQLAGQFGRNVIVSSATLATDTDDIKGAAHSIYASYQTGFACYKAMNDSTMDFQAIIIDDAIAPTCVTAHDNFDHRYADHVARMLRSIKTRQITKKAEIIRFKKNITAMHNAIKATAYLMHERHSWPANETVKLSIGLIRVANIERAIQLAKELQSLPDTFACSYHARHFSIQRFHIERRLDTLLTRKGLTPNQAIIDDPEIQALLAQANGRDVKIIIIATPVEEVGRDHDFDYAIIEPSSTQSIVQIGGRVNRHRLAAIYAANIAILQYCYREVDRSTYKPRHAFCNPGYEQDSEAIGQTTHASHDLCTLINESLINDRFDAELRFNTVAHQFSDYDNRSIAMTLQKLAKPMIDNQVHWLGCDIYEKTLLREPSDQVKWYCDGENWFAYEFIQKRGLVPVKKNGVFTLEDMSGLFTLSFDALRALSADIGIPIETAFSVTVYEDKQERGYCVDRWGCGLQR